MGLSNRSRHAALISSILLLAGPSPVASAQVRELPQWLTIQGRVVFDGGEPVPVGTPVGGCGERVQTGPDGKFSLQLGMQGGNDRMGGAGSSGRSSFENQLLGCSVQAFLAGYSSTKVGINRTSGFADAGTIVMRRLENIEGTIVSVTGLQASKPARKAYDSGQKEAAKKNLKKAETHLLEALRLHPGYPEAGSALGSVYMEQQRYDEARQTLAEVTRADPRFAPPHMGLATMALRQADWPALVQAAGTVVRLNPVEFPAAHLYLATALLNLNRIDEAEESAHHAVDLDPDYRMPKSLHVLGVILVKKGNLAAGAVQIRAYLEHAPNAADAAEVRAQLVRVEDALAAQPGK